MQKSEKNYKENNTCANDCFEDNNDNSISQLKEEMPVKDAKDAKEQAKKLICLPPIREIFNFSELNIPFSFDHAQNPHVYQLQIQDNKIQEQYVYHRGLQYSNSICELNSTFPFYFSYRSPPAIVPCFMASSTHDDSQKFYCYSYYPSNPNQQASRQAYQANTSSFQQPLVKESSYLSTNKDATISMSTSTSILMSTSTSNSASVSSSSSNSSSNSSSRSRSRSCSTFRLSSKEEIKNPNPENSSNGSIENNKNLEKPKSRIRKGSRSQNGRRGRPNLPKKTTNILLEWLYTHSNNPYPSSKQKSEFLYKTGLTSQQLSNWFINARRRKIRTFKKTKRKVYN
ncbi:hypothetical protein PACTADRAFT_84522 [Pachysolen tannophilus NRRL Y-2460]|uniref:Homeobox domain-containing protein n=1 Tax=Pachysolen tannophilus NRRL Y-2460 TaxID=669874 RepID=A0A1E4U000_PACTA|nr:hypothetical protein PACTADRAFT_84522 [Pachysolen tannophilus NRRL Y-2460]